MYFAIKIAYIGKNFHGYARQPTLRTVEGEIIKSLIKNGIIKDAKNSMFKSASRTDKGVSALGNVISFNTNYSKSTILEDLSDEFTDIIFYALKEVDSDFNPRYAKYRHYRYYLKIRDFDIDDIISTAECFTGKHDFSNFARIEDFKNPLRDIFNIIVTEKNDFLIFDFIAQNFLWNQIRRMISAIEKVGNGKLKKEQIIEALNNPKKVFDFGLAPAEPLILKDVVYDFEIDYDEKFFEKLNILEERIISNMSY